MMGRIRLPLLVGDNTWSTRFNIPKNDRHSNSPTDWTLVSFNFSIETYGIELVYSQEDIVLVEMCFSVFSIPLLVFETDYLNYFKDVFES